MAWAVVYYQMEWVPGIPCAPIIAAVSRFFYVPELQPFNFIGVTSSFLS